MTQTKKPRICVPITGRTKEQVFLEATDLMQHYAEVTDIVEIRIDYLKEKKDKTFLTSLLQELKAILQNIPVLCTFRTKAEGGEQELTLNEYEEILDICLDSGAIDWLDVEFFRDDALFRRICQKAKAKQVTIVASSHDFSQTSPSKELFLILQQMEQAGADIAKIAVMPQNEKDVLSLLEASCFAKEHLKIPFIAISMGKLGTVSRLCGETFGSCLTFGTAGKASAPGQIDAKKLKEILQIL